MIDWQEMKKRVCLERRMFENGIWDEGIVFGLDHQAGNPDALQKLVGRLSGVVVVGGSEAKRARGKQIVEIVDVFHPVEVRQFEKAGR